MISRKQYRKILKFCTDYYSKLDQTHGVEHLNRTVRFARYLAKKEGADLGVVIPAAMLHQVHDEGKAGAFLKSVGVEKSTLNQIVHCVHCSRSKHIHEARTIEAKVVFDADKLQVVGPFGVIRELCYRKSRGETFRQAYQHAISVEEKLNNALQTKTAKWLAKKPHLALKAFWKMAEEFDKF